MKAILQFLLCLIFITYNNCGSINPANYIWINFNTEVPIKNKGKDEYTAELPCEARIGKCTIVYKLLPLNWQLAADGSLIIPKEDAIKNGIFAIKAQMSQQTGEKINADLVVNIQNGFISLMDRNAFMNKNGIDLTTAKDTNSEYQDSPLVTKVPDGFPTLQKIESIIKAGNIYSISKIVNEILTQYAPCRSKINYLNVVKKILDQYISQNSLSVKNTEDQIKKLQDLLASLDSQKKDLIKKAGTESQIADVKQKISDASKNLVTLMTEQIKYKDIAKQYLQKLTSSNFSKSSREENSKKLDIMQQTIGKVNKWFQTAFSNRKILRKAQLDTQLKIILKKYDLDGNKREVKQITDKYDSSSLTLVVNQIDKIQNSIKINDIQQKQSQNKQILEQKTRIQHDKQVESSKKNEDIPKKSKNSIRINELESENIVLRKHLKDIQNVLNNLIKNCKSG